MSDLIERVEAARQFPTNTCGASRHAEQIGVALVLGEPYPMLTEEPNYCGESILATVAALWEARTEIERLTAALHAQPGPVSMDDVEWAGKAHLADCEASNQRLRAALVAAMEIVQQDRMELYYGCACPVTGKPSPEDDAALARYDAVIVQAREAMGREG